MKQRIGFVSNSSGTSFAIYGIYISHEDFQFTPPEGEEWDEDDLDDAIYWIEENNHPLYTCWSKRGFYVGLAFNEMGKTETREQFEARVEELVTRVMSPHVTQPLDSKDFSIIVEYIR